MTRGQEERTHLFTLAHTHTRETMSSSYKAQTCSLAGEPELHMLQGAVLSSGAATSPCSEVATGAATSPSSEVATGAATPACSEEPLDLCML